MCTLYAHTTFIYRMMDTHSILYMFMCICSQTKVTVTRTQNTMINSMCTHSCAYTTFKTYIPFVYVHITYTPYMYMGTWCIYTNVHKLLCTACCSKIGSLTSLDAPGLHASSDVREPSSLRQAICIH